MRRPACLRVQRIPVGEVGPRCLESTTTGMSGRPKYVFRPALDVAREFPGISVAARRSVERLERRYVHMEERTFSADVFLEELASELVPSSS